jgi:hypothetical protein
VSTLSPPFRDHEFGYRLQTFFKKYLFKQNGFEERLKQKNREEKIGIDSSDASVLSLVYTQKNTKYFKIKLYSTTVGRFFPKIELVPGEVPKN